MHEYHIMKFGHFNKLKKGRGTRFIYKYFLFYPGKPGAANLLTITVCVTFDINNLTHATPFQIKPNISLKKKKKDMCRFSGNF